MKKIIMKTILASPTLSANIGDILLVDDYFAEELFNAKACVIIETIIEEQEVELEPELAPELEPELEPEVEQKPVSNKRR